MPDETRPDRTDLPLEILDRIDRICDRFEAAWERGERPRIEDALGEIREPYRQDLLRDLLEAEIAARRRRGERPEPRTYHDRFSDDCAAVDEAFAESPDRPGPPETAPDAQVSLPTGLAGPQTDATLARLGDTTTQAGDAEFQLAAGYEIGTTGDGQRFRVLRPHAQGGLGAVFVALDTELHREVALKRILDRHADDSTSRSRFLAEAEITGGLEHPGIVPVYGLGTYADGRPFYAMRFVKGDSLKEAIDRFHTDASLRTDLGRRSLELRRLLRRFVDVCNAIEYAHSRGVLHRDIKPGNIIVGRHGETLVVDWGLAKALGRDEACAPDGERPLIPQSCSGLVETQPGSALGTPAYMSPEQAAGEIDRLGPRSDVYNLGATLYCLLVGRPPFEHADLGEMIRAVRDGRYPPPRAIDPAIHPALEAVCKKAMALQPDDRYGSARALAEDLERWMADEPVSALREPARARLARWTRRHNSSVAAGVALLGTAVVALTAGAALLNAANARTQRERDLARRNFRTARQAVDDYLTRVGRNPLLKEQGLHDLRQELLEGALGYYQDFLRQQGDAPGVRAEAAAAHGRVGDIHREQGRFEEAIADYDRGIALARSLSDDPEAISGRLRMEAARIAALTPLARFGEAIGAYERAIGSAGDGITGDLGAVLVTLHNAGTEAYSRSGRAADGLRAALKALEAGGAHLREHPEDREVARELMVAYALSARLLTHTGRGDEAIRVGRRGVEWGEAAVREHPRDIELREGLSALLGNLADIERIGPDPERAVDGTRRGVALLEDVCGANPLLFRPRLLLSEALAMLSFRESERGRIAEASRSAARSIEIARSLVSQSPELPRVRENLGSCLLAQGRAQLRSGDAAGALESFRQAVEHLERSGESMYLYNAACSLALASSVDDPAEPGSLATRRARRERDAARAVALLKSAVDHGLSEPSIPQTDIDLAPIRSREDFRAVIRAMGATKAGAATSGNP